MEKMFNVQMKRVRSLLDGGRSQTLNKNPRNERNSPQKDKKSCFMYQLAYMI